MNTQSEMWRRKVTFGHFNITQGTKKETHQWWVSSGLKGQKGLVAFDNFQNSLCKEPFAINFHVLVNVFGQ